MKSANYSDIKIKSDSTIKTGDETLDKFLSNDIGFVEGSAIFLTGTPGAGKTTFAFILQKLLEKYKTSLYSREMSASSVKSQMRRYMLNHKNAYIADAEMCPTLESFIKELDEICPKVVIVDSLQVIMKEDYANMTAEESGFSIIQMLRKWTNKNGAILIVVGHVNKNGEFEGRNTIQHMFDSHLEMIFDKKKQIRTISWAKNRKGSVGQVLYYEFGKDSIIFYTEEQFQTIKNKKVLEDYVFEMIVKFVESLDKGNPQYAAARKELRREIALLYKSNMDLLEINVQCIYKLKNILSKYRL